MNLVTDIRNRLCAGLLGVALAMAAPAVAGNAQPPELRGTFHDIGGYRLYMNCMGEGDGPTVIFDAGLGGFSLEWLRIQRDLAGYMRTCAYDRAGYGWSDPGPSPRTAGQLTDELARLLDTAGIEPPYILVGHSFGGYNVQYFAKLYPRDVAAVILVDSSHPEQAERMPSVTIRDTRRFRPQTVTTITDISVLQKYPEDVRNAALRALASRKAIATRQREMAGFVYSGSEVDLAGRFPPVPLVVITRGQRVWPAEPLGDAREAQWSALQKELVQLSPLGRQVIAEHSGHMVHLDEPQLVIKVIRDIRREMCDAGTLLAQC